ncbi:hypothetical protein CK209_04175 [Vibrio anguillarum]|nr:hypothetical protein CK209_04175 [Vibrio anguillarum]
MSLVLCVASPLGGRYGYQIELVTNVDKLVQIGVPCCDCADLKNTMTIPIKNVSSTEISCSNCQACCCRLEGLSTRGGFSTKLKFSVYGVFFEFGGALSTP